MFIKANAQFPVERIGYQYSTIYWLWLYDSSIITPYDELFDFSIAFL